MTNKKTHPRAARCLLSAPINSEGSVVHIYVEGHFGPEEMESTIELLALTIRAYRRSLRSAEAPPRPQGPEGASNQGQPPVGQERAPPAPVAPPISPPHEGNAE